MEENMDSGYEEFMAAFGDGDGSQNETTPADEPVEATDTTAENGEPGDDPGTGGGETPAENAGDGDEADNSEADGGKKPDGSREDQTFTIKVNKEQRQVSLAEMTALAQKGADYDRVKEQHTGDQQTIQNLRAELDGQKDVMEIMGILAEKTNTPLKELAEMLYVSYRKGNGSTETEAKAELENARLHKELETVKAEKTKQQTSERESQNRVEKEVTEFRQQYPDVEFTDELVNQLMPDVQSGMSLLNAYRKYEAAQKDARIAELERQLAAEKKNRENRATSPGSQRDSGGQRGKSDFDDFLSAFA